MDRVGLFGARVVSWAGFRSSRANAPWYTLAHFVDILSKKLDDKQQNNSPACSLSYRNGHLATLRILFTFVIVHNDHGSISTNQQPITLFLHSLECNKV